jgi:hypothetical protein
MTAFSATMTPNIPEFINGFLEKEGVARSGAILEAAKEAKSSLQFSIATRLNKTPGGDQPNLESSIQIFGEVTPDQEVMQLNIGSNKPYMFIHDTGGTIRSSRGPGKYLAIPNLSNRAFFGRFSNNIWPREVPNGELYFTPAKKPGFALLRDRRNPNMKNNVAFILAQSVTIPKTDYIRLAYNEALPDIDAAFEKTYNRLLEELAEEASE